MDNNFVLCGPASKVRIGAWVSTASPTSTACPSIGLTEGDVTLTESETYITAMPDQRFDEVTRRLSTKSVRVTIPFAQQSLGNMAIALNGTTASSVLYFGGQTAAYKRIYIEGPGPSGGSYIWKIEKAVVEGDRSVTYKKADGSVVIGVTFKCLPDYALSTTKQYYNVKKMS